MSEFIVTAESREAEMCRLMDRHLTMDRVFVLLLGPSATGKSTLIREMNARSGDISFEYVKPTMTRPNRPGEVDKVSVSDQEFDELEQSGKFVVVNELYGVRYGTPLEGILTPLAQGSTPILDYPIDTVDQLERSEYDMLRFYVYPGSTEEWASRVESSGRNTDGRLERGLKELGSLAIGIEHPAIDVSIVNADGQANAAASEILSVLSRIQQS